MEMQEIYLIGRHHKKAKCPISFFFFFVRLCNFLIKLDAFTGVSDPSFFDLKPEADRSNGRNACPTVVLKSNGNIGQYASRLVMPPKTIT